MTITEQSIKDMINGMDEDEFLFAFRCCAERYQRDTAAKNGENKRDDKIGH